MEQSLGMQKILQSILHLISYICNSLFKILQNGANSRHTKAGFKNYRNLSNLTQAVESSKSLNLMGFHPKKVNSFS